MTKRIYPPPPTRFAGTPVQPSLAAATRRSGAKASCPPPPIKFGAGGIQSKLASAKAPRAAPAPPPTRFGTASTANHRAAATPQQAQAKLEVARPSHSHTIQPMRRSVRTNNLSLLENVDPTKKIHTSGLVNIAFSENLSDAYKKLAATGEITEDECVYNIHELLHEEVGGNSKTGLETIRHDQDRLNIYLILIRKYGLEPRVTAVAPAVVAAAPPAVPWYNTGLGRFAIGAGAVIATIGAAAYAARRRLMAKPDRASPPPTRYGPKL